MLCNIIRVGCINIAKVYVLFALQEGGRVSNFERKNPLFSTCVDLFRHNVLFISIIHYTRRNIIIISKITRLTNDKITKKCLP